MTLSLKRLSALLLAAAVVLPPGIIARAQDESPRWLAAADGEPNLLLLRLVLNGEEIAAAIDGEERNGVVYVNLGELAEALEEPSRPPLMVLLQRLSNYFPAGFSVDLRDQTLFISGRGETAIERRLQTEYDIARRRPPPEEYPEIPAPAYRWFAPPFASFSHQASRGAAAGGNVHNSLLLFGDFLKSDGRFSAWDGGTDSSGGASLDLWRDGGRVFFSRNFDDGRLAFNWRFAEQALRDDVFWRLQGSATNAGLRQGSLRLRGVQDGGWNGSWNGGLSLSDGGGNSVFGGLNFLPTAVDGRRTGLALRFSGDYAFQSATSRRSRFALRFLDSLRLFSIQVESRRYRERATEQTVEINKRFRPVEDPRFDLALRAAADFSGDRDTRSRGQMTMRRRFYVGANRVRMNWRAGYGLLFSPDPASDFASFSLSASNRELSGSAQWRREYQSGRDELRLLVSGGRRIAWSTDAFVADDGDWGVGAALHYTLAWDTAAKQLRLSHRLAGRGALAVCANTAAGEAIPEVRLRGREPELDPQTGCAFIPAAGKRRIALDKKSLPPRVTAETEGVIAGARAGRISTINFRLVIAGEVEGVLRMDDAPVGGLNVELINRANGETAATARTAFDGGFFFFDVIPGDYLLRAAGAEREITVGEDELVRADLDLH